ncbi:MAG TPA: sigma-70 family RNA polymerase sigma factor [Planctomycetota bacterium]
MNPLASALLADAASLRRLAESLLSPGDAEDVVQDASLAALSRQGLRHPGLWLRGVVRNLSLRMRRGQVRRRARERIAASAEADPRDPASLAVQAELIRDVGTAVHALDEPFREAVLLRFWHGLPVDAIAARLCVPRNTVRSRLQRGLARLRERLDREYGERERWVLSLAGFLPLRTPLLAAFTLCIMNKKLLLGAFAVLLAAFAIPWLLHEPTTPEVTGASAKAPAPVTAPLPVAADATAQPVPSRETVITPRPEAVTTGTLVVKVVHSTEPTVGSGLTVSVGEESGDFRVGLRRAVTDARGQARFPNMAPGQVRVRCSGNDTGTAEVRAGETVECVVKLGGAVLTGIVVDAAGVGIAGALVEQGVGANPSMDAEVAAITAADGSFVVRNVWIFTLLGARAHGYAASPLYYLGRGKEAATTLRIELTTVGGSVASSVTTADGQPVRDAVVRVGEGRVDTLISTPTGGPPLPAQGLTDAEGRFLAVGIPVGTATVQVRAPGLAPWKGTCDVAAGLTANVNVRLLPGMTCTGVVRTEAGEPVAKVSVRCGRDREFLQYFTRSAADGSFVLNGLPAGEIEIWTEDRERGKAAVSVTGEHGATVRCELVLAQSLALRGRVTDEDGKPIQWVEVECLAEGAGPRWWNSTMTDAAGRFVVPHCPQGRLLAVKAWEKDCVPLECQGIDPKVGELQLKLAADRSARARITGRILGPGGVRATSAEIRASGKLRHQREDLDLKSEDGTFAIEVTAGTWEVRVQSPDHATVFAGKRELQAAAAWDLGTIELTVGGTLVVRDGGRQGLEYLVLDAHEEFRCGIYNPGTPRRSELLGPGDYLLLVRGKGIADHVLPFTIRSGQETEIELHPVAGVRQRFEIVPAPGTQLPPSVSFAVRRDGKLIGYCSQERETQHADTRRAEVWLEPGDYVLTCTTEGREGTAAVTIGRDEGPPIRITIR